MQPPLRGSVHSLVLQKLNILAKQQKELSQLEGIEKNLREFLLQRVPFSIRTFIEEEGVINAITEYGYYSTKIRYGDDGPRNLAAVKIAVAELNVAWENQVFVDLEDDETSEPHRIEIRFKMIMPN